MSSSTFTYTSLSFDSDLPPWGFHLMDPAEFEAPPSLDYVPGLEHPPSPDYVPGPKEPEQDQPLPDNASPTTLSPGYIADSDPEADLEEDPANYLVDRGDDDDDESFNDDDDDED
ncbi:hypothetical protein Tco_0951741 [Tanacetum coccineum]|uniref:Uncharacterized protein n=1 Tax=Tanacetum coccineum TaxID=301880 RepID=A0ABQ5DV08_9ASTR